MDYIFNNAGIKETVSFTDNNIETLFKPLIEKMISLQKDKGTRILVLLAAPPGAGKSTLASFLEELSDHRIQALPMDGFHHYQQYLSTHFTHDTPLTAIKGAPITFDTDKLLNKIDELQNGELFWPTYSRSLHNPIEDAIKVSSNIVLLEGNYLLLEDEPWNRIKERADLTLFIKADEKLLEQRLIQRKISTGKSEEESREFVLRSDLPNARLVLNSSIKADLTYVLQNDNSFKIAI